MTGPIITGVESSRRHVTVWWRCPSCGHRHVDRLDRGDPMPATVSCTRTPHDEWQVDPWAR